MGAPNGIRVALATCHDKRNFGSILQAYATQAYLERAGYDVRTIDKRGLGKAIEPGRMDYYRRHVLDLQMYREKAPFVGHRVRQKVDREFGSEMGQRRRAFDAFAADAFRLTRKCYTFDELRDMSREYDAVVVGSDQLWLPVNIGGGYFTLEWTDPTVRRVSYATSVGLSHLDDFYVGRMRDFLAGYHAVSVREESAADLVEEATGARPAVTCDPTMLLTADEWRAVSDDGYAGVPDEPYLLCYFMGDNPWQRACAVRYARAHGLKVVAVAHNDAYISSDDGYADAYPWDAGPGQWLALFEHAGFVCTDSFHGSVFSNLFQAPFVSFRRHAAKSGQSTNSRIDTLLGALGLEGRICEDEEAFDAIAEEPIDFSQSEERLEAYRAESAKWLDDALAFEGCSRPRSSTPTRPPRAPASSHTRSQAHGHVRRPGGHVQHGVHREVVHAGRKGRGEAGGPRPAGAHPCVSIDEENTPARKGKVEMDQELPLISVVVPVYNVEAYVRECVESIVAQTYPNLEIVLVDDGATDSSGAICDELSAAHENVTCLHKENGGLSDARNYGLARSRGEWISFVDSDDWVSPAFISALYVTAVTYSCSVAAVPGGHDFLDGEDCSLVDRVCLVTSEVPRGVQEDSPVRPRPVANAPLGAQEVLRRMLYQEITTGAQWRLYRREVLGEDPFPKGLYYEDLASTYKFVHRAGRVALVDCRELYAYRKRRDSIIRQSYRHVKGYSAVTVAEQLYRDISEWYPDLAKAAASRCFSVCRMVFGQVPTGSSASKQDAQDRKALWEVLCRHRGVVVHDPGARPRERLAACIACVGEGPFTAFCHLARRVGKMQ